MSPIRLESTTASQTPESRSARQKWDARYADSSRDSIGQPTKFVTRCLSHLPTAGYGLDIAAGAGRHSLALARHGLHVHAVDISWQGLRLLQQHALVARLEPNRIRGIVADVELPWLPHHQYEVILATFFLYRPLFPLIKARLLPGGWLIYETFTIEQAELSEDHAPRSEFLLESGELKSAFSDLEIVLYDEDIHEGRATAQLLAKKL